MMKKFYLAILLCLVGVCSSFAFDYTDENGVTWTCDATTYDGDICAYIYGVANCPEEVTIPENVKNGETEYKVKIIGYPNVNVGYYPFYNNTAIKKVTLPSTVEMVCNAAFFGCSNLESINLSTCTNIGQNSFYNCSSLANVGNLSACTSIADAAFYQCTSLTDIGSLSNCTSIGGFTFYGCSSLVSIGDLSACTSIGRAAFANCTSLSNVGNMSACTSIGDSGFSGCKTLKEIGDLPVCISIDQAAFADCMALTSIGNLKVCNKVSKYVFQNCTSLTTIGDLSACKSIEAYAFCGCSKLTHIGDLPVCTSIGDYAFSGQNEELQCTSLASVGDLSSCTSIGNYAFSGCTSLSTIGDLSSCTSIGDGAFGNCSSLKSIDLSACTNIGAGSFSSCTSLVSVGDLSACTNIGGCAFGACTSLTSIGDLSKCKNIEQGTFGNCTSLSTIGDLSGCMSIGESAFSHCTSLKAIGALSCCTSIETFAFYDCTSLISIGDLSSCTSIGNSVFYGCTSLTNIGDLSACTCIGNESFYNCCITKITLGDAATLSDGGSNTIPSCMSVLVPASKVEAYRTADNWSNLAERIISKDAQNNFDIEITETPSTGSAIQNVIASQGGDIANAITLKVKGDINAYDIFAIRNKMPNLHVLDLSDANIKETDNGFCYYSSYQTSDNVLGNYAFYGLGKLLQVKLPKSLKRLGFDTFGYCSNLCSVQMYEGLENIGNTCFIECDKLNNVIIPEGVKTIESQAFYYCDNVRNVSLPNTLETIGYGVFDCCKIDEITLPSNLVSIEGRAFLGNPLKEITLPASLKSIGSSAFDFCENLKTVKATAIDPNTVSINDDSFSNYSNATLYIPYDEESDWEATKIAYEWNTQWGQFGNRAYWKPNYEHVILDADYDQATGTIPGTDINADFGNQSGYILGEEGKASQSFDDVHITNDGSNGGSIIADDNLTINNLYCDISINSNRWYFFCFPFDVKIADIKAPGLNVMYKYDGGKRAAGNSGWTKLGEETTTLTAGQGYIFQCNTEGTLEIPVANPDFTADGKSPALETHTASNKQDASWNFVGNPYLSYYELEDLGHDAPVTYWNGSGYTAVRPGDDDYAIQPYQAFFVQKTEESNEVAFNKDKRETYNQSQNKANAAKALRAKAKINPERLLLNVTISDGENTDKTRVVFNDKQSMEYETECDASKFMSTEAVPQIYTSYNNVNYAINERPNGSGEVQLCFKAPKDGTYTIAMSRMDTPMLLKDAETGMTFDFQNGEYTFDAKAGTYNGRFILVKNNSADAIQPLTVGDAENAEYFNVAGQKTTENANGVKIVKTENGVKKVLTK